MILVTYILRRLSKILLFWKKNFWFLGKERRVGGKKMDSRLRGNPSLSFKVITFRVTWEDFGVLNCLIFYI